MTENVAGQRPKASPLGPEGESEENDEIREGPLQALSATLPRGLVPKGTKAPPLAHWLFFLRPAARELVGADGHPWRSEMLPGADLPRRMWAGSDITFYRSLPFGARVTRHSRVGVVGEKNGRSGRLAFVQIDHEVFDAEGPFVIEHQDIVYRQAKSPGGPPAVDQFPQVKPQWRRRIVPDPVLLFRYSALMFNGHRIHYDRPYAIEEEGYPGLVVHGPLLATFLLYELMLRHPGHEVTGFRFRAAKPVVDIAPFDVCGSISGDGHADLFITDGEGALCMTAAATLR